MSMRVEPLACLVAVVLAANTGCSSQAAPGTTFVVRPLGASAGAFQAQMDLCLRLPGASGGPTGLGTPAMHSAWASGDAVESLRDCVEGVAGADIEVVEGRPGDERGRAAFIERCIEQGVKVEPGYVGMSEQAVQAAEGARAVRVICRDRAFLDRTNGSAPDQLSIVVERGKVLWAGRF